MSITCGRGHAHPTVAAVRACYTTPLAPAPVAPAPAATRADGRHVVFTESEPTPKQLASIARLGGVVPTGCTRGQASSILTQLYARKGATQPTPKETRVSTPAGNGLDFPGSYRFRTGRQFPFPASLLFGMHEARYAVSLDGSDNLTFIRLSLVRPFKSGKQRQMQGCMKVQTQHSDDLIERAVVEPGGQYLLTSNTMSADALAQLIAAIVVDQRGAAARYGRALKQCCRCGKALTDERSRWYGIGPECEKHWEDIVNDSDEARGVFQPSGQLVNR